MKTNLTCILILTLAVPLSLAAASKPLRIWFVDVEGGQATLFVSPSGESMLVDTGWADHNNRDADRIMQCARAAHIRQIDYLVITHYHADHVGGVPQLAAEIPIRNFVDHGPTVETNAQGEALYQAYLKVRAHGRHLLARPGMKIPISGMNVEVVTAAGNVLSQPLPSAGANNPYCPAESQLRPGNDTSENAQSTGILVSYGKFRMIDLGDLTWRKEYALVCPMNKVGTVSVYLTTQHGYAISGERYIVDALHPAVAIGDNGARKGGTADALKVVRGSPGLKGFWDLHYSYAAGDENAAPEYIANLRSGPDQGNWIEIIAYRDGVFTVVNGRNHKAVTYRDAARQHNDPSSDKR
ncbi:MAG: ComEC/Rec2 family competence protein [Terriglobia bacterium]